MRTSKSGGSSKATEDDSISEYSSFEQPPRTKGDVSALKFNFSRWEMIYVQVLSTHMYSDIIFLASQHFRAPEFESAFPPCEDETPIPILTTCQRKGQFFSLDNVVVLGEIHKGTTSYVIQVSNQKSKKEYAMKIYVKSTINSEVSIQKILMEVKIMKLVATKGLYAHLFATFQTSKSIGILMEHFPDGNIRTFLNMPKRTSLPEARVLLAHLAVAVTYLHDLGIVHRDIRPESILVHRDTKVKLSSFGCCKFTASRDPASCGCSHDYLAPELALNKPHSFEVDWWAFGMVAYEVIFGNLPEKNFWKGMSHLLRQPEIKTCEAPGVVSLITGLLQIEPKSRLGCGLDGFKDIAGHEFFEGINWKSIFKFVEVRC